MNTRKFMHLLLIAVLCYGQLVANVHLVSHFHAPERVSGHGSELALGHELGHAHESSVHGVENAQRPVFSTQVAQSLLGSHQHPADPANGEEGTSSDCAIYHAYLGLGLATCAAGTEIAVLYQRSNKAHFTPTFVTRVTQDSKRIRAPPSIS